MTLNYVHLLQIRYKNWFVHEIELKLCHLMPFMSLLYLKLIEWTEKRVCLRKIGLFQAINKIFVSNGLDEVIWMAVVWVMWELRLKDFVFQLEINLIFYMLQVLICSFIEKFHLTALHNLNTSSHIQLHCKLYWTPTNNYYWQNVYIQFLIPFLASDTSCRLKQKNAISEIIENITWRPVYIEI